MNNVPNEGRIIMLSCTEISFVLFSILRNLESSPLLSTHTVESQSDYVTICCYSLVMVPNKKSLHQSPISELEPGT